MNLKALSQKIAKEITAQKDLPQINLHIPVEGTVFPKGNRPVSAGRAEKLLGEHYPRWFELRAGHFLYYYKPRFVDFKLKSWIKKEDDKMYSFEGLLHIYLDPTSELENVFNLNISTNF